MIPAIPSLEKYVTQGVFHVDGIANGLLWSSAAHGQRFRVAQYQTADPNASVGVNFSGHSRIDGGWDGKKNTVCGFSLPAVRNLLAGDYCFWVLC